MFAALDVRVITAGVEGLPLRVELAAVQVITKATWLLLAEAEVMAYASCEKYVPSRSLLVSPISVRAGAS